MTHVDNTSVAEALVRLLGADDQTATFMPPAELAWLQQTDVLQVGGGLTDPLGSDARVRGSINCLTAALMPPAELAWLQQTGVLQVG